MASTKKSSTTTEPKKGVTPVKASTADKPKAPAKSSAKPVAKAASKTAAPAKAITKTKPAAAKPAAAKPAKAAATPRKTTKKSASSKVSHEQRCHYIEVAAYYIAERRGFVGGNAAEDWAQAEREVERLLAEGLINAST
jgi:surface antigen